MKTIRHKRLLASVAIASTLLLGACGTQSATGNSTGGLSGPGVDASSKTITIGEITALSGPADNVGKPVHDGLKAYLDQLNASGGIDGWKVDLNAQDSAYDPQKTVQLFNQIKDKIALLSSFGTGTTQAIQPLLDQEKLVTGGAGIDWSSDPQLALLGTPYAPQVADLLTYIATNKEARARSSRCFTRTTVSAPPSPRDTTQP